MIPNRISSMTGRTRANSESAWPSSFLIIDLITCLWLRSLDRRAGTPAGPGPLEWPRGPLGWCAVAAYTAAGLHLADDLAQQGGDGAAEEGKRDDHGDGDHAQHDGVLRHRLSGLVLKTGEKRLEILDQGNSPPSGGYLAPGNPAGRLWKLCRRPEAKV